MTTLASLRILVAGGIVCAVASCGESHASVDANLNDAIPRQTITITQSLPSGLVEEGVWLTQGDDQIGLEISAPLAGFDWDIHAHENGGTQDVASGFSQSAIDYSFLPPSSGSWYLLLRNSSTEVLEIDVQMDLYGDATWSGWQ